MSCTGLERTNIYSTFPQYRRLSRLSQRRHPPDSSRGETYQTRPAALSGPEPLVPPSGRVLRRGQGRWPRLDLCDKPPSFWPTSSKLPFASVDANVTNPSLHSYFGVSERPWTIGRSGRIRAGDGLYAPDRSRAPSTYERGRTILGTEFRSGFGFPASCRTNTRTPGEFRLCFGECSACNPRLDYRLSELIVRWRRPNR